MSIHDLRRHCELWGKYCGAEISDYARSQLFLDQTGPLAADRTKRDVSRGAEFRTSGPLRRQGHGLLASSLPTGDVLAGTLARLACEQQSQTGRSWAAAMGDGAQSMACAITSPTSEGPVPRRVFTPTAQRNTHHARVPG